MTAIKLTPGRVQEVSCSQVHPDPNQPRQAFDKEGLRALADNIKQRGIQQPMLVRVEGGKIFIKDGERRWRAAQLAKLKKVPVLLADDSKDAAQRGIDQVAVNSLREELKPIELARFLVKLRDEQKLSPNQIAARLEKDGMKAMSRSHVSNLMRLVDLPDWAGEFLNEGAVEATAARGILAAADFAPAMKAVEKAVKQRVEWSGKATVNDIDQAVVSAYRETAIDLKKDHAYTDAERAKLPHFDWKKICAGCAHLKSYGGGAFCLNAEEFKKKNAEAKAAGLDVGGKKPKAESAGGERKLTAKQEKALEREKVEERKESLGDHMRDYLHAHLISKVREGYLDHEGVVDALILFGALWRPGVSEWEMSGFKARYRDRTLAIAARLKFTNLAMLLNWAVDDPQSTSVYAGIAGDLIAQLPWEETQMLAHHIFGTELAKIWRVDGGYLSLLRKAELAVIAKKHCELPEGKKEWTALKAPELHAAILAKADSIPVPPDLQKIYKERHDEERQLDETDYEEEGIEAGAAESQQKDGDKERDAA